MKLDANALRYLGRDDFRTLTAVEMGQKNHEIVPAALVESVAGLRHGGARKCLRTLLRHKLVHHDASKYEGYRLTTLGYDFLALRALAARGAVASVGRQIGTGKESDVYEAADAEGRVIALKLHRLGRTSFRAVKGKRDYAPRSRHTSWLYLSRVAALKEFAFMKALGEAGLPVPEAIDVSRHAVLMSMAPGVPLVQVREVARPARVYAAAMGLLERLARLGLVHCDFNEFNLLIDDDERLTLIDFPQCVSTGHANAPELFERDVAGVRKFFERKLGFRPVDDARLAEDRRPPWPTFAAAAAEAGAAGVLDAATRASGFKREHQEHLERWVLGPGNRPAGEEGEDEEEEEEDEESGSAASGGEEESGVEAASGSGSEEEEQEALEDEGAASAGGDEARAERAAAASASSEDEDASVDEDGSEGAESSGNDDSDGCAPAPEMPAEKAARRRVAALRVAPGDSAAVGRAVTEERRRAKAAAASARASSVKANANKGRNKGQRKTGLGGLF